MSKSTVAFLLPLLAMGAAVPLEPRQTKPPSGLLGGFGGLSNMFMPKRNAFKIEQIEPKTGIPGALRTRYIHGPYKLGAANSTKKLGNGFSMDKGGTGYMSSIGDDFPRDITVLEVHSEIQNPDFTRTGTEHGIYNHHNVFMDMIDPGKAFGCDNGFNSPLAQGAGFSVFGAGATEDGKLQYYSPSPKREVNSGYYISKDRNMINMIDVINYNKEEKVVYTSTEIEYLPGKPAGYLHTTQQRIDPGICGGPPGAFIHPPKGVSKFSIQSQNIVALRNGYIVNARGHMHDGGLNIVLKINDVAVCDSKAVYGGAGHTTKTESGKTWETISESTYCPDTIKINKGDKIHMQANYDLELHPSREMGGGHGAMMRNVADALDGGGEAEQMALMVTNFAFLD